MRGKTDSYKTKVIKPKEYQKYLVDGKDFIDEDIIREQLKSCTDTSSKNIDRILEKSLNIETLTPEETATLLNVEDKNTWEKMAKVAHQVKLKVYDNRIVTFAPLYCSNLCVNDCKYCGFRIGNTAEKRIHLSMADIRKEAEVLAGKIGHKRLIVVYGEHPSTDARYIADTIEEIYDVNVKTRSGRMNSIRRININAAPMCVDDLKMLKNVGIGTYQVFQETYHKDTYRDMHPENTIKGDYRWRLYAMHRAIEAGIDDVACGALFGLYDWRFEIMGLQYHTLDLEKHFGIGIHTVSFPRLMPAGGSKVAENSRYLVSDEDLKKIIIILRLSIPYTGMIITARESKEIRDNLIPLGCTQTDASTRIGIGGYARASEEQDLSDQQFLLGDTRELDDVIRDFADKGIITSFCTAGYRCGRTGDKIMRLLRSGKEGQFCKLNAILTFKEWLEDFATEQTKIVGARVIKKELDEVKGRVPDVYPQELYDILLKYYKRIENGERDLYV